LLAEGITPLEVLLKAMRDAYVDGGAEKAAPFAKEAAPYMHPRLSAVAAKIGAAANPWEELVKFVDGTQRGLPGDSGKGEATGG
jgi:hypothetical protein